MIKGREVLTQVALGHLLVRRIVLELMRESTNQEIDRVLSHVEPSPVRGLSQEEISHGRGLNPEVINPVLVSSHAGVNLDQDLSHEVASLDLDSNHEVVRPKDLKIVLKNLDHAVALSIEVAPDQDLMHLEATPQDLVVIIRAHVGTVQDHVVVLITHVVVGDLDLIIIGRDLSLEVACLQDPDFSHEAEMAFAEGDVEEVVRDFVKKSQHLWLKLKYFLNPYPIVAFETLVHLNSTDCAPDFLLNCLLL